MLKRLTDFVLRRNTREEIVDQVPVSQNYQAQPWAMYYANLQERPRFNLFMVELMLTDPRVAFGLAISNGLLMSLKVTASGPDHKVVEFVQAEWDKIWESSAHQILRSECYGYMAYEVMYREEDGLVKFDRMLDRYPADTRPLTLRGHIRGIKIDSTRKAIGSGVLDTSTPTILTGMKGLWLTHDEQYSNLFGRSALLPAYPPWYEKTMKGGTLDLRKLRMTKDAWMGDCLRFPEGKSYKTESGAAVSARDMAAELQALRASGGGFVLPSTRDTNGNLEWDYTPPTSVSGVTALMECITAVDCEIFDGLLLPREVVEAAETGSGFSGRSIPFMAACTIRDVRAREKVKQIKAQVIDKLVGINFGLEAAKRIELTAEPLLETIGELMGDMGQPNTTSQAGNGQAMPWLKAAQQQQSGGNDEQEEDVQFADSEKGQWITIGGHSKGDADHAGGTPVKVHRGQIVAGPPSLTGKRIKEIADKRRPDSRVTQAIRSVAMEWGVNKRDLYEAVEYLHKEEYDRTEQRESSKKRLREVMGLTAADIQRIDESGRDYSSIKNFDVLASEASAELSGLGLGGRDDDGRAANDNPADQIWELLKEGRLQPRARHDQDLIEDAARLVLEAKKFAKGFDDDVPFSVAGYLEHIQFSIADPPSRRDRRVTRRAISAGATLADDVRGRIDRLLKKKD